VLHPVDGIQGMCRLNLLFEGSERCLSFLDYAAVYAEEVVKEKLMDGRTFD